MHARQPASENRAGAVGAGTIHQNLAVGRRARSRDRRDRCYNPGDVAHHIVEQGRRSQEAQAARKILQKIFTPIP